MTFSDMVTQSVFARALAIVILALVMVAAVVVAAVDLLQGHPVPDIIQTILGIGIGTAGTMIGVNFGVVLQPMKPETSAQGVTTK